MIVASSAANVRTMFITSFVSRSFRLAFEAVNVPLCNLGAWLFNEREERAIANGMFRWLLAESREVGSDEDLRRYGKNVGCGP